MRKRLAPGACVRKRAKTAKMIMKMLMKVISKVIVETAACGQGGRASASGQEMRAKRQNAAIGLRMGLAGRVCNGLCLKKYARAGGVRVLAR